MYAATTEITTSGCLPPILVYVEKIKERGDYRLIQSLGRKASRCVYGISNGIYEICIVMI